MSKLTGAALDKAVANAMGLKSVNDCEKWKTEPTTRIADNVWWHVNKEARKQGKLAKPPSRIDSGFEEWAKRTGVDLNNIPLMRKEKKR